MHGGRHVKTYTSQPETASLCQEKSCQKVVIYKAELSVQSTMSEEAEKVQLYIYDLSRGLARQLSMGLLGKQIDAIYHTSIVVGGKEVGHPPSGARSF